MHRHILIAFIPISLFGIGMVYWAVTAEDEAVRFAACAMFGSCFGLMPSLMYVIFKIRKLVDEELREIDRQRQELDLWMTHAKEDAAQGAVCERRDNRDRKSVV